jgi:hypothetical protein
MRNVHLITKHIYITSDKEIKMDDWYLDDTNSVRQAITECESYWTHRKKYQKIILTTDPDLIAEGVQAIDDDFLEWFVKNPSCESVEVGYGWIRLTETGNEGYWVSIPDKQFEMQQEEPKQETLKEAAEIFVNNRFAKQISGDKTYPDIYASKEAIIESHILFAKWQQDRMYSEENVFQFFEKYREDFSIHRNIQVLPSQFEQWFEQFKKK